jgi:hypothetical protein
MYIRLIKLGLLVAGFKIIYIYVAADNEFMHSTMLSLFLSSLSHTTRLLSLLNKNLFPYLQNTNIHILFVSQVYMDYSFTYKNTVGGSVSFNKARLELC